MARVPSLDELAAAPEKACALPQNVVFALITKVAAILAALAASVAQGVGAGASVQPIEPGRIITLEEASNRLGVAKKTLSGWTRTKPEWGACVITRTRNRVLLSLARFEAVLRNEAQDSGSLKPTRLGAEERKADSWRRPAPLGS
jgi:hypothetical protein